ncbi:MAG: hypothetical protein K6C97_04920 [Treponema sp.]|nr:hypothetical protein [Treponema sp.]
MIKTILSKIKQLKTKQYGIESTFFEIGKKYKVKDGFVCRNMVFIKDEELVCLHNCLSWYDGFFVISFQNQQDESKYIYIDECYLDNGRYWPRPDTDCIKELQSYEKYFVRLS